MGINIKKISELSKLLSVKIRMSDDFFIFLRFCENIGRKSETNSIKISCIFANVNNI